MLLMAISVCLMTVCCVGSYYIHHALSKLPKIDTAYFNSDMQTQILDKHGNIIYESTDKIVFPTTYEALPQLYVDGLLSVEDKNFWTNNGFSYFGLFNVGLSSVKSLINPTYKARGGSTIDQQLIKNTYYKDRKVKTVDRKIHELFLSRQLDKNFSKNQILTHYINKINLGEKTVGIKSAMKVYFNDDEVTLNDRSPQTIAKIAYLVGLGQAPSAYDLYIHPELGMYRTKVVLSIFKEDGLISDSEYDDALAVDLPALLAPRNFVIDERLKINREFKPYSDGVFGELESLHYNVKNATFKIQTYLDSAEYRKITNTVRNANFLDSKQQIGVSVIDSNGIVRGMVGMRNNDDELNRAIQTTRSSGSSLKPFTAYAPLLDYLGNSYNTSSKFDSSPYRYPGTNVMMYNYGRYSYGYCDMNFALRKSLNTPVARIDDNILGSSRMKTFLNGVGLDNKDSYSANDGIGLNVSTLQAAAAYNALNNRGMYIKPRFINTITFIDGTTKQIQKTETKAMNESTAFVINQILRGVPKPNMGSAEAADISSYAGYGGKTGTVAFDPSLNPPAPYGPGGSDSWYNSITNGGFSISIWTGYDVPNTSPQIPDNYKMQQTLGKHLQEMLCGSTVPNWTQPDTVRVLGGSGLNTQYAVTDSHDVGTIVNITPQIDIPQIDDIVPKQTVDRHWKDDVDAETYVYYKYYKNHQQEFNSPILTTKVYNILHQKGLVTNEN